MALTALFGEPQKRKIKTPNGELVLEFPILTVKDLAPLMDAGKNDKKAFEAAKQLVFKVLKRNFPETTLSDVENLPAEVFTEILNTLMEVNGFEAGESPLELKK